MGYSAKLPLCTMISIEDLSNKIRSVGFMCRRCGTCCRCVSPDSDLVMVSPPEVRAIISSTGLAWDRIVTPYPETISDRSGARITLGWCLHREGDRCRFLDEKICTIYAARPWICRTYPFMLDEDTLLVSPCEGLGEPMSEQEATSIATRLLQRQCAEKEEEHKVRLAVQRSTLPAGAFVVIDSDGAKVIDG